LFDLFDDDDFKLFRKNDAPSADAQPVLVTVFEFFDINVSQIVIAADFETISVKNSTIPFAVNRYLLVKYFPRYQSATSSFPPNR
jgi:hypothetical protein